MQFQDRMVRVDFTEKVDLGKYLEEESSCSYLEYEDSKQTK